jgi:alkanesulfonate monooxygenase SsuD/methylene tetrahydromethanopterin reductase-like flavin-dependent oxidoreductase (luciferase family)
MEAEANMYGTDLGSTPDRLDRLEEALDVIRGLFSSDNFDYELPADERWVPPAVLLTVSALARGKRRL